MQSKQKPIHLHTQKDHKITKPEAITHMQKTCRRESKIKRHIILEKMKGGKKDRKKGKERKRKQKRRKENKKALAQRYEIRNVQGHR